MHRDTTPRARVYTLALSTLQRSVDRAERNLACQNPSRSYLHGINPAINRALACLPSRRALSLSVWLFAGHCRHLFITYTRLHTRRAHFNRHLGGVAFPRTARMCGILAALGVSGDAETNRRDILKLSKLLRHRGPDASGVYQAPDGKAFIAFERLSIVDPSPCGKYVFLSLYSRILAFSGEWAAPHFALQTSAWMGRLLDPLVPGTVSLPSHALSRTHLARYSTASRSRSRRQRVTSTGR